ncbi:GNAT family N-acetyltransferase [Streptomyces sp. NPDC003720]|uniref:GNAT family N-acetyltransferase n=1 Tax=Streptomyces sp. NPDC003720 TaxID=3364684 RepID=UPI0036ABD6F5
MVQQIHRAESDRFRVLPVATGLGGRMMTEFLAWAGPACIRLGVVDCNERAIRFYRRHGFEITGEPYLWRGKLPTVLMTREATSALGCR